MEAKRYLFPVSAAVVACLGAAALVAAAASDSGAGSSVPTVGSLEPLPPLIFAPTTGREEAVFEYRISESVGDSVIRPSSIDATGACVSVELEGGSTEGCFDAQTIAAGIAYGAFGHSDGTFVVIGIVPDAVDTVEVGGKEVTLTGNVWSTRLNSDAPASLTVGDSTTDTWATLPPR